MTFKPKSITEKLFTKKNVFHWIETLENASVGIEQLEKICRNNQECDGCPFPLQGGKVDRCMIFFVCNSFSGTNTKEDLQKVLNQLYKTVEENGWEDDDV